ncbi:phospholipase b-related [Anaeramoeba flamelloides]|uniref:Phospholipase B-like n=1 Tax=Anaeramoeba flamelloides TaxID=1746091 RepID=A0AAV7YS26_9EUKA|nr:phospholipase b-related [Anaeramoeba flamelloides]|eukprot:Anaeramoba_flamelloidesa807845_472.p1 GENE.a807845_472~~a807845_472.p1  ORF type:complete len:529 (-),score=118.15 a807845_472:75-1661(-)
MKLTLFLLVCLFVSFISCSKKYGTIYYDQETQEYTYAEKFDLSGVATAMENDEVEQDGWEKLAIRGSKSDEYDDFVKATAMGLLEGILSHDRILDFHSNWINYNFPNGIPDVARKFAEDNLEWVTEQTLQNIGDEYWDSIGASIFQIKGIVDGLNWFHDTGFDMLDIYLLNINGDIEDICAKFNVTTRSRSEQMGLDHCSGLIKLLEDGSDIYVSQATWNRWYGMLRQLKYYEFNFKSIPTADIVFSGYAGVIASLDSYYQIDKSRILIETTLIVFNADIYQYVTTESVLTTLRVTGCNRYAKSGKDWAQCIKQHNSGTYNNEWLIVDYDQWEQSSQTDVLWVCGQMPGKLVCEDTTSSLLSQKYVPSYNIPRITEIYNYAGYDGAVKQYGNWFDYELHPRAQIFKRNQSTIKNLDHMKAMMRYNNWENDPLSNGSPGNAISSRKDLIDPNKTPPNPFLQASCFGGLDAKIGSYADLKKSQVNAELGPTHDQQPVFTWKNAPKCCDGVPHQGQPDIFDFDWIVWRHQM